MAHGFLTPQSVSGDRFWQNTKWLLDQLDKRLKDKKKEPQEKGGGLATTQKGGIIDENVKAVRVTDVSAPKAERNTPPAAKMLRQSAVAGALKPGVDSIVKKEQLALPPGGPRLPGGASPSKGGTFTNIPGVSAAPKKLDSEAFFKAAQTGVHPETGKYLSSEERKDYLRKSKAQMNAPASVAAAGASGIGSSSSITKGDEQIVGSIENLTKVTTSLVDAVKNQTSTQKQSADKATAKAETIANRAKATEEEKALEQGTDNSSFITPSGGIGSPMSGGGPGGGGGLGLGTALGAAGKIIGKAAPGIGARGAARVLPRAGAAIAGKAGAKSLMKLGGKTAARMIPGAQTAIGLGMAGEALSRGDILGAALSAGSAIPGPLGWGFLAADVARDLSGGGGEGKGMARGGLVTGGKKSVVDDVPIRADEGEVVMSNAAGNTWGRSTLLAMNAMGGGANKPTGGKGYAEGGLVGGDKAKSKQMFKLFGEGMIDAQKANSRDFAKIQSQGLRQYYENEGGFKKMGQGLKDFFATLAGGIASLFGGAANAATGNPADYLDGGIGGSTAERNAAAFLSTLEGSGGQTAADTFQVMLNRTSNAKSGGSMKAYGTTLFDQITAQGQFSPFAAAIYDRKTGDDNADAKYGKIRAKLGKNAAERKAKLLEIAGGPNGLAELQKLFGAGSGSEAAKVLADFESGGAMSKSSAQFVGAAMSFRGYHTEGSRRRSQGGNYFFGAAQGTRAASLNAVSAAPEGTSEGISGGGLTRGAGTFIQGNTGASRGDHFHIGPDEYRLGGKQTSKGLKDARDAAFKVAKGLMAKGTPFYFSNYTGFSSPWYKGKGDRKTDEQLRNAILAEQNAHAARAGGGSWGGIDIAAAQGTRLPIGVGPVADRGDGFGNAATISGTKGFVGHGASGSRATKASELMIAASPAPEGSVPPRSPAPAASPANRTTGNDVAAASAFYTSGMRNTRGGGNTTVIANSNNGTSGSGSSNSAGAASGSSGMGALSALRLRVQ